MHPFACTFCWWPWPGAVGRFGLATAGAFDHPLSLRNIGFLEHLRSCATSSGIFSCGAIHCLKLPEMSSDAAPANKESEGKGQGQGQREGQRKRQRPLAAENAGRPRGRTVYAMQHSDKPAFCSMTICVFVGVCSLFKTCCIEATLQWHAPF